MNPPSREPTRSVWPAALVAAFLHGIVWTLLLLLLIIYVPTIAHTFMMFNMRLPAAAEAVVAAGRWLNLYWYLVLPGLVVLVLIDAAVLRSLDRQGAVRLLRELWSGVALGLPVLLLVYAAFTLTLPSAKLMEGITRSSNMLDKAAQAERARLEGTWKLVGHERGDKAVDAAHVPAEFLTLEGDRYVWVSDGELSAGTYSLSLRRKPKEMTFLPVSGPAPGVCKYALYKLEGDKLTLVLAPPDTFGDALPEDFTTSGNRCELLVWQRKR